MLPLGRMLTKRMGCFLIMFKKFSVNVCVLLNTLRIYRKFMKLGAPREGIFSRQLPIVFNSVQSCP